MTRLAEMRTRTNFFRSDIEGIRAIAILLVIGAHFAIPGFSAGFIGVDIFFVLSGFLITGILVREYNQNNRIDLAKFYANRFRRLFPSLATMLVISSLAAYWILPDTQNLAQSKAAAMAAVWLSNIHFTFADVDYFAAETSTNLFLHTWSLGVEEQFYLLWPLLILLAMAITHTRKRQSWSVGLTLLLVSFVSLAACLLLAKSQPALAFYMMPTRAWQFAAGGAAWLLVQKIPANKGISRISCIAASLLLLAAMFFISPTSTYPSSFALLPTLATCALLWAGSSSNSPSQTLLSQPFMQWFGRLSYAWYLWHWPTLILAEHLQPVRGNIINTIGVIALSLLLAIATHHLIENPIRFGKSRTVKPSWQIGATLILMVLINSQMLRWHTQTSIQLSSSQNDKYTHAILDIPFFYQDGCDDWYQSDELKPCHYGNEGASKTAVLLGDSIGAQWFPALTAMYHPDEWELVVLTKSSCPMVDEPFFYQRIGREYTECSNWRSRAIEWIVKKKPDAVFMGSTASNPFTDQQLRSGSRRILEKLSPAIGNLYLIEANPVLGFNGPECLLQNHPKAPEKCATERADNSNYQHVAEVLKSLITDSGYNNIRWLETASFVCPNGYCSAERNGVIVFRDSQHLTASFTASAAEFFSQQIKSKL